jgi:hypothetical protein
MPGRRHRSTARAMLRRGARLLPRRPERSAEVLPRPFSPAGRASS